MKKQATTTKNTIFAKLSGLSISFSKAVLIAYVIVAVFGALSYTTFLKRDGFPAISIPLYVANVVYFVDDVEAVDRDIALPYTEFLQNQPEVEEIDVVSNANFSTFQVALGADVDSAAFSEKMRAATANGLPEQAQLQVIDIDPSKFFAKYNSMISVYGSKSTEELFASSEALIQQLESRSLVELAESIGQSETAVNPVTGEQQTLKTAYEYVYPGGPDKQLSSSVTVGVLGNTSENLDIFELKEQIDEAVAAFNAEQTDVQAVISADFTKQINEQVSSLESNVLSGLVVVMIVTLLLISWRVSVLSAIFMLTVIFTTVGILFLLGYTLNTITLFALVLALGLFVDDATIISESIDAHKHDKGSPKRVVLNAIQGVGSASASGTATTILVFVPLLFVSGIIGEFIFLMPLTIIIALLSSLFISLTLIPVLSRYTILSASNREKLSRPNPVAVLLERVIKMVHTNPIMGRTIAVVAVLISIGFIMGAGQVASRLTFNIFPPAKDGNEIGVTLSFPGEQANIETSEAAALEAGEIVLDEIGDEVQLISYVRDFQSGAQSAQLFVELTRYQDREPTNRELVEELETRFESFEKAAVEIRTFDAGPPTLSLPFLSQIFIDGNAEQALPLAEELASELEQADLVRSNGDPVAVTRVEVQNVQNIARNDGRRFIQVAAGFDAADITTVVGLAQEFVEDSVSRRDLAAYGVAADDIQFDFGQESDNADSFATLGPAALASLAVMFVLLAVQFRSIVKPLLIFLALPFSLFGVTLGLFLTDNPMSFFAVVGFIGLIGIAVNNTILLTDYANQKRRAGEGIVDSIAEATRERFRPLATTTLTTVAALAPLAFSDPFWQPLAVTIMAGLLSSTFLVIVAFPYYYMAVEKLTVTVKRLVLKR